MHSGVQGKQKNVEDLPISGSDTHILWHSYDSDYSSAGDNNEITYTKSSDLDSKEDEEDSNCVGDSFLPQESLLTKLEIPLTESEERLIEEFCKEMTGVKTKNDTKYKEECFSGVNCTKSALERIESVANKYLEKGIRLNAYCNNDSETVMDLIFKVMGSIPGITPGLQFHQINQEDNQEQSCDDKSSILNDENSDIVKNIVRELLLKGGKVRRYLFYDGKIEYATTSFIDNFLTQFDDDLFAQCEKIKSKLKDIAQSIINKSEQTQKDELKVDIDNGYFCIEYPQDNIIEPAKILSNASKKDLNLRVGIFKIGESIVRVDSVGEKGKEKRNYTDVSKGSIVMSFTTEVGEISIYLSPDEKDESKIKVEIDEENKARLNELKNKKSLGENCLLGGKSVLQAINDQSFVKSTHPALLLRKFA